MNNRLKLYYAFLLFAFAWSLAGTIFQYVHHNYVAASIRLIAAAPDMLGALEYIASYANGESLESLLRRCG